MVHIYLLRHAESTWNAERRWQGQADPPLSAAGRLQADRVAERLRHVAFDAAVTSDLARARETAESIVAGHDVPIELRTGFRERDVGDWTGHTTEEIEARFPDQWAAYVRGDDLSRGNGETVAALRTRVASAFDALLTEADTRRWRTICVVAHGGVVRAVAEMTLGLGLVGTSTPSPLGAPRNTALAEIANGSRGLRLLRYNDELHLEGTENTALDR